MSLLSSVIVHEGFSRYIYLDSVGVRTVGFGRNLDDRGISREEAEMLLLNDLETSTEEAKKFEFYENLTSNRRDVIVEMIFNLGLTRFKKFKKTINYINQANHSAAADEMLDSKWADQVGQRAITLSNKFRAG
tara:strand:- start:2279 stop:2677 length:399 start_codon:yes stop_codon:yes gene_type:complete